MAPAQIISDVVTAILITLTRLWRVALPLLSLAVITLIAVVPLGLGTQWRFVPTFLPIIVIHYWADRRALHQTSSGLPVVLVFAAGIAVDAMTNGPLGYWALVYLATTGFSMLVGPKLSESGVSRWLRFVVTAVAASAIAWIIASIYFSTLAETMPLALAWGVICLGEPLIVGALTLAAPQRSQRLSFADRRA